ncbi:MAG: antitoxin family protein [Desulfurococcales archaeon]|nr:antitoxin family protein [Desulfurococcales archaeon]
MSKVIKAVYRNGVLKLLEPVDLEEGEEVQIIISPRESIADRFYGIARKHRANISKEEFLEVLEEIEDEDLRGHQHYTSVPRGPR